MTPTTATSQDERRSRHGRNATTDRLAEGAATRVGGKTTAGDSIYRQTSFRSGTGASASRTNDRMKCHDGAPATRPWEDAAAALRPVSTHPSVDEEDEDSECEIKKELDDRASPTSVAAIGTVAAAVVHASAEGDALAAQLEAAHALRLKMAANLRAKKAQLEQAHAARSVLEAKVAELQDEGARLRDDNDHLRAGLQKVVAHRDDAKSKLRAKNEVLRELRADKDDAERRLKRLQAQRAVELELLGHYRKLAQHTGYCKWGKPIRALEAQLDQQNLAESQQQVQQQHLSPTSPHNHHNHK